MSGLVENLPEGYRYAEIINGTEVVDLRDRASWGTHRDIMVWRKIIKESITTVGVRADGGNLVGIGFLAGNSRHAVLCDFVVDPEHRNLGIGKAILHKRVNEADRYQIPYLYASIGSTNTLAAYYEELGFAVHGEMIFRDTRDQHIES